MESAEQSTLAILAGGQGSRMGRPKAQLELDGQPILTYLLNRFAWKGPRYLITAPGAEHPPGATEFDLEIADPPAPCDKPLGPLRGILTALENLHTPLLMVTTVDMPALETVHLSYLLNQLVRLPDLAGLMFTREIEGKRIPEPFPLALRPGALPVIRDRLATP
ncbi:MAG TPA: NTP transferase domain-containing protein, partial [Tepidisphaeraceae bacterium]